MRPLEDVTFMIPVRIDSPDRAFNLKYVISYLTDNFNTRIIIKESDSIQRVPDILGDLMHQKPIWYEYEHNTSGVFHRTRLINEMLSLVSTPVVANYDTDVIIRAASIIEAKNMILWEGFDLVFPFLKGKSQYRINRETAIMHQDITKAPHKDIPLNYSLCGFCQFLNTESYRQAGMQNEQFLSWGPEDREFLYRFEKLNYKIIWLRNYVYHLEHERGKNSGQKNPHFISNEELFSNLQQMDEPQLREYYRNALYLAKYST